MKHSGLADSPFFTKQPVAPEISKQKPAAESQPKSHDVVIPTAVQAHDDIKPDSEPDTVTPRHHDTTIETVRQAVKVIGKEAATHRFTTAEKEAIAAIVYGVKQQGIRTSENEIARIAVNFILCDYEVKKEHSLLVKVLQALNA